MFLKEKKVLNDQTECNKSHNCKMKNYKYIYRHNINKKYLKFNFLHKNVNIDFICALKHGEFSQYQCFGTGHVLQKIEQEIFKTVKLI